MYNNNTAFKHTIESAVNRGEIDKSKDPEVLAWYLGNSISGLGIFNKSWIGINRIDRMLITTLSIFEKLNPQDYWNAIKNMDKIAHKTEKMLAGQIM